MPREPAVSPPLTPASAVSSKKRKLSTPDGSVKVKENAPEDAIMTPDTTASPTAVKTEPVVPVTHDDCLPELGPMCHDLLNSRRQNAPLYSDWRSGPLPSALTLTFLRSDVRDTAFSIIRLEKLLKKFREHLYDLIEKETVARRQKVESLEREAASYRKEQALNESFRERISVLQGNPNSSVSAPDI